MFGDHGFGERFTKETPLYIAIIAKDKNHAQRLEKEITPTLEQFKDRIQILSATV